MSLQMSSRSEEYHEGNTFDGESREANLSASLVEVNDTVNDLFEEIDRYHDQEQATLVDLSNEIDVYRKMTLALWSLRMTCWLDGWLG